MTEESRTLLHRQLKQALDNGDMMALQRVQVDAMMAMIDCQKKTADRVKMVDGVLRDSKAKFEGAKLLMNILYIALGALGSGTVIKLISILGSK